MGEPGRLPSIGSDRVGHNSSDLAAVAMKSNSLLVYFYNFPESPEMH